MVRKSLTRALANLEDQAGCVTQVLVAYVNPAGGAPLVQKCVFLAAILVFTDCLHILLQGIVKGRPCMV